MEPERKTKMTYGKNLNISRSSAYQRNHNVVTARASRSNIGPVTNVIVLVILACLLGLIYLTQLTKTNSLGYQVNDLSRKQTSLKEEYASLQVDAVRLQNLDRVKNSQAAQAMVENRPTAYVNN